MARTISILTDNRTADPGRFGCEYGLSVVLQTPSAKVLMDTGASGLFSVNAARMGIDLSDVDYVFLSHGHSDHVGGLHSISCDWPLEEMRDRTLPVDKTMTLADGIHVIAGIPQRHPLPLGNRLLSKSTMATMESSFPMLHAICRQNLSFPSKTNLFPSVSPVLLAWLKYSFLIGSRSFHSSFSIWMNPFRKTVACLISNRGMSEGEASNRPRNREGIVYPFSFSREAMDT